MSKARYLLMVCALVGVARAELPDALPTARRLQPEDLAGFAWRSVGPANMGGRVADLAMAPGNPKTFYIAYATGGLFKTVNGGTTFSAVFDRYETGSIGAVAVADASAEWAGWADVTAPAAENSDSAERGRARVVWVGTGEGNGRNSSSWGHGVYVSIDSGATFTHVGLAATHDIPQLAVDPRDPDTCYVAAMGHLWGPNPERGLYKTTDRGRTWQAILQVDDTTGCCDVVIDPQNPDVIYAAMYTRQRRKYSFEGGSERGGIFRSRDAGVTWEKLTAGLPQTTGRIGLDVFPGNSAILYATVESDDGGRIIDAWHNHSKAGGVFRSDDHGSTWERRSTVSPRPFYFSRIRVDPQNAERVYLPAWGLGVSDDGGRTFRAGLARIAHVDMHALIVDPQDPEHLILGTDGGAYVSRDRGATWDFLNQLAVGQFYNIAVDDSDPYRIGGGLQDNGTWIGPSATHQQSQRDTLGEPGYGITNADWRFINNGDGFHVAFDPVDSNIIYCESQGGELVRVHLDSGRRKRLKPAAKEGQPRFRFNWNAPFVISPADPTTLYFGGNHLFRLTDRGDAWSMISPDLSTGELDKMVTVGSDAETYGTIVSLAVSSVKPGVLWVGTDDGRVHLSMTDGAKWQEVTPPDTGTRYIAGIAASQHDAAVAYVAVDGHRQDDMTPRVWRTLDRGRTWESIVGDLPRTAPVKVIREDPHNPAVLYAGTERAAYVSIDRGGHWVKLNGTSLPTVAVDDIRIQAREHDVVVGTHGRSIYVLDDVAPLAQLDDEVLNAAVHLFEVPDARPRIYLPYGGLWSHRMFRAKNPAAGARLTYWLTAATRTPLTIAIRDAHGNPLHTLTGTTYAGFNRLTWDLQFAEHDRFGNPEAWMGQTRFVPAGEYTAVLTMGEHKAERPFTVHPSPIAEFFEP